MATAKIKTHCIICDKEKPISKCDGCLQEFCHNHWVDHQQNLNKQLDKIEINRDVFRLSFTQQIEKSNDNNLLIQQIDQWKHNSIKKIQEIAEETKQILLKSTNECIYDIEMKFDKLNNQLKRIRQDNDYNEISLHLLEEELKQLTKELIKLSNISIREDPTTALINKIYVDTSELSTFKLNIQSNTTWLENGSIVAGGNGEGHGINQLNYPMGLYIDNNQMIYIADALNHRIVKWKYRFTHGKVVAGDNGQGNKMNQLNSPSDVLVDNERNNLIICDSENRRIVRWPRQNGLHGQIIISNIDCCRLAMDNGGHLYVSDYEKDEIRRWKMNDTHGTLVAGGNGKGNRLDQLNHPTFIFIDDDHSIYVSDYNNDRVMKWTQGAKEGIIVAGGHGKGNDLAQLSGPTGLFVDHLGTLYVADRENHRIMRWFKGATQGDVVVGRYGHGKHTNQLHYPAGLSFDQQGNLYVVDQHNHRVQRFDNDRN